METRQFVSKIFEIIDKCRINNWIVVGMWVGITFYEIPITTTDIDIAIFMDIEKKANIENLISMLRETFGIEISVWKILTYLRVKGFIHLIPKNKDILLRVDIINIDKYTDFYDLWLETFNSRLEVSWENHKIYIPTLEHWIALKLISFRNKDKLQLITML
ncbi:MAG: hypothetical protein Q6363_002100, partial [Candidatus Njordarchaeota archaeon]